MKIETVEIMNCSFRERYSTGEERTAERDSTRLGRREIGSGLGSERRCSRNTRRWSLRDRGESLRERVERDRERRGRPE